MEAKDYWKAFERTGDIAYYLAFRSALEAQSENNGRRAGDLGEPDGGSGQGPDAAHG